MPFTVPSPYPNLLGDILEMFEQIVLLFFWICSANLSWYWNEIIICWI